MVIVPMFDRNNILRGVIHLINSKETSVERKLQNIDLVCKALTEIISLCDDSNEITNISAGLAQNMENIHKNIDDSHMKFKYNLSMD